MAYRGSTGQKQDSPKAFELSRYGIYGCERKYLSLMTRRR